MKFEWDRRKAAANVRKHEVSFEEASTVFGDPLALTFVDPDHSDDEQRYLTFGHSAQNRLLVVVHTDRDEATRIISARTADAEERRIYEEGDNA
jgi:uncharacterized protein